MRFNLHLAQEIAEKLKAELEPHCERIEIAGSIRREKETIGDIEIVAIPKPYEVGLFESGIATVVNQWEKVKGELPCKYTQRIIKNVGINPIKLDLFFAEPMNWGYILAIRTGSAEFSKKLAQSWVARGCKGKDGYLHDNNGDVIPLPEEEELFTILGLDYVPPKERI